MVVKTEEYRKHPRGDDAEAGVQVIQRSMSGHCVEGKKKQIPCRDQGGAMLPMLTACCRAAKSNSIGEATGARPPEMA